MAKRGDESTEPRTRVGVARPVPPQAPSTSAVPATQQDRTGSLSGSPGGSVAPSQATQHLQRSVNGVAAPTWWRVARVSAIPIWRHVGVVLVAPRRRAFLRRSIYLAGRLSSITARLHARSVTAGHGSSRRLVGEWRGKQHLPACAVHGMVGWEEQPRAGRRVDRLMVPKRMNRQREKQVTGNETAWCRRRRHRITGNENGNEQHR